MPRPPRPSLAAESTIVALGETQLPAPAGSGEDQDAPPRLHDPRGGRYTPLDLLGQGGMGVVHSVWDGDLMRELAVKRIRGDLRAQSTLVAQFLWEARVTAYLDHPNIVPVHDLGVSGDGELYFTMKRAQGRSLDHLLERLRAGDRGVVERLPLARRVRIVHQVAQAISFAHGRGILHRDLKPANVVLGDHGELLVMDWGLAVPLPGPAGARIRAVMPPGIDTLKAGTPLYMSPEQARGEPLDERSDVFTLGVMLYELGALVRPFDGKSAVEITERIVAGAATPLREVWREAPAQLVAVVERALQKDPALRYPTVDAFAADLERLIDGETPTAERLSPLRRFARFYMGRDRGFAALRVVDLDMWSGAVMFGGGAIALAIAGAVGHRGVVAAVLAVLALAMGVSPTRRWWRMRRGGRGREP